MAIQQINLGSMPLGAGGDTQRAANTKINANFTNSQHAASKLVGTDVGQIPQVQDVFVAWAKTRPVAFLTDANTSNTGAFLIGDSDQHAPPQAYTNIWSLNGFGDSQIQLAFPYNDPNHNLYIRSKMQGREWSDPVHMPWAKIYHSQNTNKGTNGELSEKSPVTHLFSDRLEHTGNELELKQIEFVKKGIGHYLLKNTTGLAKDGWYILMPKDANGNPLVAVEYEDNNGDVTVRTYKRKFDFEKAAVVADHDNPMDIPESRWIDLRFNDKPELYKKDEPKTEA